MVFGSNLFFFKDDLVANKKVLTKLSLDHKFEETPMVDYQYFFDKYTQIFFVQEGAGSKNYDHGPFDEARIKRHLKSLYI